MQILLQDKYNIGVLMVDIEFIWLDTKWMERLAKACLSLVSKPRCINTVFTVNTPILHIYIYIYIYITSKMLAQRYQKRC